MTDSPTAGGITPVIDSNHRSRDSSHHAADAAALASAAAEASGVQVREVSDGRELVAVQSLFDVVWQASPASPLMTGELLRALAKSGNYIGGAFEGNELVGASVGFFGAPAEAAVHSHISGVSNAARGRSVGFALKLHQRAWSMQRGVSEISWTYDPLVRRNSYFNLVKLAARPEEYLTDFYGGTHDGINAGDETDRLLVRWRLDSEPVRAACAGAPGRADADAARAAGAAVALGGGPSGAPVPGALDASTLLVAVPPDIERLRLTTPGQARDWRSALREVLGTLMAEGARVTGFDRSGWYVVRRPGAFGDEDIGQDTAHDAGAEGTCTHGSPLTGKEQR
ncbi:GNAT family N-acetyltransferase [Streptomyces sp. P5-A9]|uniref:GNAT family N-acetyltransferase n=1 Tax=Streptomyces sp. P5-A9 TaxID=3071730 RepID=UPI002FC8F60A